jgi:hypothetical protein
MNSEASSYKPLQPGLLSPIGFALLFAVFLVMYFQSLTGLSLTADDDGAYSRMDPAGWVAQGRWGAYLVERFIMPLPVITFLPYALFGACLCVSFALLAASLGVSSLSWPALLAFAFFIGVPQWLFVMEFSANLAPIGIGFLCASASAFTFYKASAPDLSPRQRIAFAAPAILLLCLAMSPYQSLLVAGLLMSSAVIMVRLARAEVSLSCALWMHAGIAAAGAIAYALCIWVNDAFFVLHPHLQRITFYADELFRPREAIRDIPGAWTAAVSAYKGVVWGDHGFYGTSVSAFGLATVALGVVLIVLAFRSGAVRGLLLTVWLAAAWLAVVVFQLVAGGPYVPFRAMVQLPALSAVLAIVGITFTAKGVRAVILLLLATAVFQESMVINRAAASHELVATRDAYIAGDLFRRIASVGRPGEDGLYKIQTLGLSPGKPAYPMPHTSYMAFSWFAHESQNSFRVVGYMRMLGYPVSDAGLKAATLSQQWASMPSWPAEGSVAAFGDVTLIKLNEVPGLE